MKTIEDQIIAEALTAKGQDAVMEIARAAAAREGFPEDESDLLVREAAYLAARAEHQAKQDRRLAIIELAKEQHPCDGIEIDSDAKLSEGDDNGCYVAAWVWTDFNGTPFEKPSTGMEDG